MVKVWISIEQIDNGQLIEFEGWDIDDRKVYVNGWDEAIEEAIKILREEKERHDNE